MNEPGFVKGMWIVHENYLNCELDRVFVPHTDDVNRELVYWLKDIIIEHGDTIRFESGVSEIE